jgi:CheY-like chemotaxis protein
LTKVLIVDDDFEMGESLGDVLEAQGFNIEKVTSGPAALEKIKRNGFNAALVDLKMPGMNGVETYRKIKQLSPRIKVIMMTAYSGEELVAEARRTGELCLFKPLNIDLVLQELRTGGI